MPATRSSVVRPIGPLWTAIDTGAATDAAFEGLVQANRLDGVLLFASYSILVPGFAAMSRVLARGRIAHVREHGLSLIGADIAQW